MVSFLTNAFFVLFLLFFQISLIPNFFAPLNKWQLFLSIIVVIVVVLGERKTFLLWVLLFGGFLSFYSIYPFYIIPALLAFMVIISNFLFKNFFTNQSWYTVLALSVIVSVFYNFFSIILKYTFDLIYFDGNYFVFSDFLINLCWAILVNSLGAVVIFKIFRKLRIGN